MRRKISLFLFLFLTIFSGNSVASHMENSPQIIELRPTIFDRDALKITTLKTGRSETEIIEEFDKLTAGFIAHVGTEGMQEIYDINVGLAQKAKQDNNAVTALKTITSATLAARVDPSVKLQENFGHGFMTEGNSLLVFVGINF